MFLYNQDILIFWDIPVYHTKLTISISDETMHKKVMVLRAIQLYIFLFAIVLFIMVYIKTLIPNNAFQLREISRFAH